MTEMNKAQALSTMETSQPNEFVNTKSIGSIIATKANLSAEQVATVVEYQIQNKLKFGEAAVALGFAHRDTVVSALAEQYRYPYLDESERSRLKMLVSANSPFGTGAEFFRDLRTTLSAEMNKRPEIARGLAIVSPRSGDGKSFLCANLGVVFSQMGLRTLVLEANMRNPSLAGMFSVEGTNIGLSAFLSARAEPHLIRPSEQLENLYFLPAGAIPPNPNELLQSNAFDRLLANLQTRFDLILIDTPSSAFCSDSRVVAAKAPATLAVYRKESTRVQDAKKFTTEVTSLSGNFLGGVLNDH
jgi:protein-tyrosine kinase